MKHTKHVATATLLLLGVVGVSAQSLGDYARAARKNKPDTAAASRHYDNDNLPFTEQLSVVGPPPSESNPGPGGPNSALAAANTPGTPAAPAATGTDRQKAADEWQKKIDKQKEKIAGLSHELDLDQREYRLKAAAFYGDAGARLRDAAQFDKDGADHKNDIEAKQKAIDTAQQELESLQEQARKAGVAEKENDKDAGKDNSKDKQ